MLALAAERAGLSGAALERIRAWLGKLLEGDQHAKLEQGGHKLGRDDMSARGIPLAKVFVDLPVTEQAASHGNSASRSGFLGRLKQLPPVRLSQVDRMRVEAHLFERRRHEIKPAGFVLIGGPGQGKSTLGQYACQLYRAWLLSPVRGSIPESVRQIVDELLVPERGSGKDLLSKEKLFPLRVALPEAAAWLAATEDLERTGAPAFCRFLAARASGKEVGITAEMLATLIPHLPVLLVLDGLDEVGAREDRDRVISAANEVFAYLAERDGSAVVVATTRPQGYSGELERLGIPLETLYLAPLTKDDALNYAGKLFAAKIPGADELQHRMDQMRRAAEESATEHLLTTPLQVTILAALVQQIGRAPSERWRLFNDYFDTLFKREIERGTFASELLRRHRTHIEKLHERVGLLLQVESEASGGSAARMSQERLAQVADMILAEEDISAEERARLVRDIVKAAAERLVLLVEPEPGSFGFEIRSLQELMAARALTDDTEPSILEERLMEVARSGVFRNTLLFIASRFFSEASRHRDLFAARICPGLEAASEDPLANRVRAGARLALDILEEGSVETQPKRARALMEQAIRLLDLPACKDHVRLAAVVTQETEGLLSDALERKLASGGEGSMGAWVCLCEVAARGATWAAALGDRFFQGMEDATPILAASEQASAPLSGWIAAKIQERPEAFAPEVVVNMVEDTRPDTKVDYRGWLHNVLGIPYFYILGAFIELVGMPVSLRRIGGTTDLRSLASWEQPPPRWEAWSTWARFETSPSKITLARFLRAVSRVGKQERRLFPRQGSWPVAACLGSVEVEADFAALAISLEKGELGDVEDWLAAERRWETKVKPEDWIQTATGAAPWSKEKLVLGPPIAEVDLGFDDDSRVHVDALLKLVRQAIQMASVRSIQVAWVRLGWFLLRSSSPEAQNNVPAAELLAWAAIEKPRDPHTLLSAFPDKEAWLTWLDGPLLEDAFEEAAWSLCRYVESSLRHPALLRPVVTALATPWLNIDLDRTVGIAFSAKLAHHPFPRSIDRGYAAVLRLCLNPQCNDVENLVQAILRGGEEDRTLLGKAMRCLQRWASDSPAYQSLLLRFSDVLSADPSAHALCLDQMRNVLRARRSDLANEPIWQKLDLPLPLPEIPRVASDTPVLPTSPVALTSFEIRNILGIAEPLTLTFTPPQSGKGQWIALVGPNGTGKTTILRSLVLALRDLSNPKIWPKGAFATSWRNNHAPDNAPATISVKLGTGQSLETRIRKNGTETFHQTPPLTGRPLFPVFAYGCRRGSALGGMQPAVDLNEDDGPEVATLFHEGAALIHAETWLKDWHGAALASPGGPDDAIFKAVIAALCKLLAVSSITIEDRAVWVSGDAIGARVPLAALSDGYLTMAGWYLDLIARWIELCHRYKVPVSADFPEQMTGLVLLDEIDVHLHPEWQIDAISRIRELLPKMSFVITTHNPLTLVGARSEEIFRLSRSGDGKVHVTRGAGSPETLTSAQILEQYFGIDRLFPSPLGDKLHRYGFLSGYALRDDSEQSEMERLRAELRAAAIDPGWEEVPRRSIAAPKALHTGSKRRATKSKRAG